MLYAIEGRLHPYVTGKMYCSLISACEELGDLRRAPNGPKRRFVGHRNIPWPCGRDSAACTGPRCCSCRASGTPPKWRPPGRRGARRLPPGQRGRRLHRDRRDPAAARRSRRGGGSVRQGRGAARPAHRRPGPPPPRPAPPRGGDRDHHGRPPGAAVEPSRPGEAAPGPRPDRGGGGRTRERCLSRRGAGPDRRRLREPGAPRRGLDRPPEDGFSWPGTTARRPALSSSWRCSRGRSSRSRTRWPGFASCSVRPAGAAATRSVRPVPQRRRRDFRPVGSGARCAAHPRPRRCRTAVGASRRPDRSGGRKCWLMSLPDGPTRRSRRRYSSASGPSPGISRTSSSRSGSPPAPRPRRSRSPTASPSRGKHGTETGRPGLAAAVRPRSRTGTHRSARRDRVELIERRCVERHPGGRARGRL